MEARSHFTVEGLIEMVGMMGYIRHFNGRLPNSSLYFDWVDAKSGEPVDE